ncbi:MAG: glycosyltransferase family 9 protein [Deltaproteobacteria bacterium]|nr:glycosyltransferase family 9 protein [Deltaproteobacteria bacterium]
MALPALSALAAAGGPVRIACPAWGEVLYRDLPGDRAGPRAEARPEETAVLFPPSFRSAWLARRARRRIGLTTNGRGLLLTDGLEPGSGHRRDDYAALALRLGLQVEEPPRFRATPAEREAFGGLPVHVGLNPVSRSGPTVEWPFYAELAAHLREPVRVYAGPGEEAAAAARVPGVEPLAGLDLGSLAGALARCRVLVSNDTGVAHFAAACGTRVVVIHGSTTALRTGPAGSKAVEGPDLPCRPCYRKRCPHPGVPCLSGILPERVWEALR